MQGGSSPDVDHFVNACAALNTPATRCFVALEERSASVMDAFLCRSEAAGFTVVSNFTLLFLWLPRWNRQESCHSALLLWHKHAVVDIIAV